MSGDDDIPEMLTDGEEGVTVIWETSHGEAVGGRRRQITAPIVCVCTVSPLGHRLMHTASPHLRAVAHFDGLRFTTLEGQTVGRSSPFDRRASSTARIR